MCNEYVYYVNAKASTLGSQLLCVLISFLFALPVCLATPVTFVINKCRCISAEGTLKN